MAESEQNETTQENETDEDNKQQAVDSKAKLIKIALAALLGLLLIGGISYFLLSPADDKQDPDSETLETGNELDQTRADNEVIATEPTVLIEDELAAEPIIEDEFAAEPMIDNEADPAEAELAEISPSDPEPQTAVATANPETTDQATEVTGATDASTEAIEDISEIQNENEKLQQEIGTIQDENEELQQQITSIQDEQEKFQQQIKQLNAQVSEKEKILQHHAEEEQKILDYAEEYIDPWAEETKMRILNAEPAPPPTWGEFERLNKK